MVVDSEVFLSQAIVERQRTQPRLNLDARDALKAKLATLQQAVVRRRQWIAFGEAGDGTDQLAAGHHDVLTLIEDGLEFCTFVGVLLVVQRELGVLVFARVLARSSER